MRLTIFAVGTLGLLTFICWLTYRTGQLLKEIELDVNPILSGGENWMRLVMIGGTVFLGRVSGLGAARLGWTWNDVWVEVQIGLVFGLIVHLIVHPLTHWAVRYFGDDVYSPQVIRSILPRIPHEWVLVPLAMLPAVLLEELLFRSLLLGGFSVLLPPLLLAIVFSLLFGFMHAPQGSLGVVTAGALSLLLSLLFLWRGTLVSPVVAHYTINLLQLLRATREREWLQSLSP